MQAVTHRDNAYSSPRHASANICATGQSLTRPDLFPVTRLCLKTPVHLAAILLICIFLCAGPAGAQTSEKLVVYTSMKDSLIGKLATAFTAINPNIEISYQSGGAGSLMGKINSERSSGKIMADVLWTSEVPDFYRMKAQGLLEKYISPEVKNILNPLADFDGSFTPVRLGTLGIAYNTNLLKEAPSAWHDLEDPSCKDAYGIANPALSGTAYLSVALLVRQFGWEYFNILKANGAKVGRGSSQVVEEVATGKLAACLGVDYIVNDKIKSGAPIALVYPHEMLVIPSPVCIFRGSPNMDAAKKFVDFILSKEGQTIIAAEGTLPVRKDVPIPAEFKLPSAEEAMRRSIKVGSYTDLINCKDRTVKRFSELMQAR